MTGWIKLHRKLQDKGFYTNPSYLALWIHILLSANHEPKEFMWNGRTIVIRAGQFITGRKKLAKMAGVPETTVERVLDYFEREGQIGQQKTTKYRLVTVLNWHEHQVVDSKRTTNGQQTDTNKNEKKERTTGADAQVLTTNTNDDMSGFNKYGEDYLEEDLQIDPDHKPKEKVVRHYKEVYDVFKRAGIYSLDWVKNTTEQNAGDNLYTERGLEQIAKALSLYLAHKDEEYCPHIYSPSSLIRKWKPLLDFKKKNGL